MLLPRNSNRFSISIHALREESDVDAFIYKNHALIISIHALREESDAILVIGLSALMLFQSTLSVRRATSISPSALLAGRNFNPRSP